MNTTYFLNQIMGNLFQTRTSPPIPTNYYLGLSTSAPQTNGEGVKEPSTNGTGYTRVALTNLSEPTNGVVKNTKNISFSESLSSWGTITHYVVYDAPTNGNLLFYGTLAANCTVDKNAVVTIKSGELTITLSNDAA